METEFIGIKWTSWSDKKPYEHRVIAFLTLKEMIKYNKLQMTKTLEEACKFASKKAARRDMLFDNEKKFIFK